MRAATQEHRKTERARAALIGSSVSLGRRALWLQKNAKRVLGYKRKSAAKAYAANPEKFTARSAKWRKQNNERARKRDAIYRAKYAKQRRAQFAAWRKDHPEYFRQRHAHEVADLANWYVRAKLSRNTSVRPSEWPEELVELMRINLKVKRLCRESKTSNN